MTIHLPKDVENSIEAAVHSGHFASVNDAMAEAARLLLCTLTQKREQLSSAARANDSATDPILGLMRNDADLKDEIVADAYRQRREENWRELDL
jgi:Arc/MetJ-type ribon-helix-helix transcriptional regulator